MKKIFAVVLAAVLALSMVSMACADAIKLAVIGPMTGAAASYGNSVANGAAIAAAEINAAAGADVVELIVEDDTHNAEVALNAYNAALDAGAQAIVGTVTTSPCIAVSAQAFEDRVFMLTPSASSTAVTADKDNCYQLCFTDPAQGTLSAQYIMQNKLGTTIGVIYNNADAYSTGIYQTFVAEMEAQGMTIAATSTFTDDTTDFSVQVADMKNAGCDLVFLPIYYAPASQILVQANATEYAPVFFGVDGMDGILTSVEGFDTSLAEGVMLLTPFSADAQDEQTVQFVTAYEAAYNMVPDQFAADGYDCVYAMVAAFSAAGLDASTTPEDACDPLIAAFQQLSITGVTGTMSWGANGEVTKSPKAVVIENGTYVTPHN